MIEIRKKYILFLAAALLSLPALMKGEAYKPGEILVKLEKGTSFEQIQNNKSFKNLEIKQHFITLSRLRGQDYLLLKMNDLEEETESTIAHSLVNVPEVEAVSLNYTRRLFRVPNDPLFIRQWGFYNTGQTALISRGVAGADINAPEAWDINTGSDDVVIAVIDTGFDYLHEDLKDNIWINPGEIPGNGIDDDGNGYVDDVYGYDFAADLSGNNDNDPMGFDNHGTHVAGIIAARGNNGIGVTGVCWNAKIMAIKGFRPTEPDAYIYLSDEIEAFDYIVMMKTRYNVNVVAINCSYGGSTVSTLERDAIEEAGNAGIIVCAAAGNGGDDSVGDNNNLTPEYPASHNLPNILSVAATDVNDELAGFSNYGSNSVDIAAPGTEIKSTVLMGQGDGSAYVEANGSVFNALPMEYSGYTNRITRALYYCGRGLSPADFPAAVLGNIALIERGDITFAEKAANARDAGAAAAIIFNNVEGVYLGTLGNPGNWLPVLAMSREKGLELLGMGNPVITLENLTSNYGFADGTSMSAPMVSGAVGLLASRYPREDMNMRITRILLGADPLPSLRGRIKTGARLNMGSLKIKAPLDLQARQVQNRSFFQAEFMNIITWQANPLNQAYGVVGYRVYQVNGKDIRLIAEVGSQQKEYWHRDIEQESHYTYAVVAIDAGGSNGEPALVSF